MWVINVMNMTAAVPDLETRHQPRHQHPALAPHLYQVPCPCTNKKSMAGLVLTAAATHQ